MIREPKRDYRIATLLAFLVVICCVPCAGAHDGDGTVALDNATGISGNNTVVESPTLTAVISPAPATIVETTPVKTTPGETQTISSNESLCSECTGTTALTSSKAQSFATNTLEGMSSTSAESGPVPLSCSPNVGSAPLTVLCTDAIPINCPPIWHRYWQISDGRTFGEKPSSVCYPSCRDGGSTIQVTFDTPGMYSVQFQRGEQWPCPSIGATLGINVLAPTPTPTQQPSLVKASVVPQSPMNGQSYVIHMLVNNPNGVTVPGSMTSSETTVFAGWNDTRVIEPYPNPVTLTIPANGQSDYTFQYLHHHHPFEPLELTARDDGSAAVVSSILAIVPVWVDDLEALDYWLNSEGTFWQQLNCRVQEIFDYTFASSEIYIPPGSFIRVIVDTPLYKKLGLADAIYSGICGAVYTTVATTIPPAAVPLWEIKFCLSIAEYAHLAIASVMEDKALDPDIDYTEPISVQPIIIPELDSISENPLKDLVMQYNATVPHALAMKEAFSKYNAAVEANDTVWETKLLKECYRYDSMLGDDFRALNVKAVPAMQYLQENGVQPTPADIQSAKQNISQNGLPDIEVTLLKRMGFSDLEIDAMKEMTVAVPDAYSVNYSTTILQGLNLLQRDNTLEVAYLSEELGPDAPPYANFTASTTTGKAPLSVQFTDTSLRSPDQWLWEFGDDQTTTAQNAEHTYTTAGTYTVSLTVTNSATGSDTRTKYELITVIAPTPPIASFTATPTTGKVPLTVQFTDTSLNTPTSWLWDFGDGTTATAQNPDHTYQNAGIYTVILTATNADGSESKTMPEYITVIPLIKPIPDFSANVTSGKAPLAVKFTDLSANGPLAWAWSFGDGYVSTEQNPVHRYDVSGTYTVALDATNADGSSHLTKPAYITVIKPDNPTDLIDQLIIYINNQNNVPKMFRVMWTGQLKEARRFLDNDNPSDAVALMKYFKFSVGFFKGWIITSDQAATLQNSADAIIKGINLPVNQQAIDQTKSLSADVKNLKLPASVEHPLILELEGTLFTLECAKDQAAVSYLNMFISSVQDQDWRTIPHDMADQLIAKAEGIKIII